MTKRRWSIAFAAFMLSAQALSAGPPTRLLVNGNILTMDASDRIAQALAIEGDKIVAVGSDAGVRRLAGPDTSIIDLGGRTVIPSLMPISTRSTAGRPFAAKLTGTTWRVSRTPWRV
jgi:adenine deaminase